VAGPTAGAAADIAAALVIFAIGALMFHFNLVGGGDVKLFAAGALWIGAGGVWPFLFVTALAGGALSLVYSARFVATAGPRRRPIALPYGVAIAAGGIFATAAAL
jgi:prepilin peptidase CpaA